MFNLLFIRFYYSQSYSLHTQTGFAFAGLRACLVQLLLPNYSTQYTNNLEFIEFQKFIIHKK